MARYVARTKDAGKSGAILFGSLKEEDYFVS